MDRKTEIQYLRIALGMQRIFLNDKVCNIVIETIEAIKEKGGELTMREISKIEAKIDPKNERWKTPINKQT